MTFVEMQTIDTCRHLFLKYAFCINWQKCTASLYSCFVIFNMLDTVIVVLWQNIDEDFLRYCCLYMTFLTGPTLFREINEFVSMYNSCYANIRTLFEHVYLWTKWCRDFFFFWCGSLFTFECRVCRFCITVLKHKVNESLFFKMLSPTKWWILYWCDPFLL